MPIKLPPAMTRAAGRAVLKIKHVSPEILIGVGVTGVVATVIMAAKATLKAPEIIEAHEEEMLEVKEQTGGDQQALATVYAKTGIRLVKLYAPTVLVGVVSIASILGSHKILRARNVALASAYKALEIAYDKYRARVIEIVGEEQEEAIRLTMPSNEVEDPDNPEKKALEATFDPNIVSPYARFFDETCKSWSKSPEDNLFFLSCHQNHLNDKLKSRGHVFLNEVYDAIGIPRTTAGQVVGWFYDPENPESGDNFIDFNIYNLDGEDGGERHRAFVNGHERSILLDFNVDGIIYDKI